MDNIIMEELPQSSGTSVSASRFGEEAYDELGLVFRYLNFQELSVCRTVSKLWYDASLPRWLEAAPPKKLWEEPQDEQKGKERTSISGFLDTFHGGGGDRTDRGEFSNCQVGAVRQFRKFSLEFASADSDEKCESQWKLLKRFLTTCGGFITHLELDDINLQNDLQVFEQVMYSKYTPNLQKLIVSSWWNRDRTADGEEGYFNLILSDNDKALARKAGSPAFRMLYATFGYFKDEEGDWGRLPIKWVDFLSHFPTLKCLDIDVIKREEILEVLDAISQIRRADKTKTKLAINSFYLEDYYTWQMLHRFYPDELLDFYRVSQLPLEDLDIRIFDKTTTPLVFELINLHSASLKTLCLRVMEGGIVWNNAGLDPPFVEHLHKLEINGKIISSLKFLKMFPNLEVLILSGSYLRKLIVAATEEEMEGVMISSLKKLTNEHKEIFGPEEIRKIAKWMPSLTSLQLAVTNDGLRVACESWPFMESMNLAIGLAGDDTRLSSRQSMREYIPVDIPKHISLNSGGGLRNIKFKLTPYDDTYRTRRRLVASSLEFVLQ